MKKLMWAGLLAMSASSAFANEGGMGSGGGKGVVCFSDKEVAQVVRANRGEIFDEHLPFITSLEALDLKYAKLPSGLGGRMPLIVALKEGEDYLHYLGRLISRIKITVPYLEIKIQKLLEKLDEDHLIFREAPIVPIFDANDVSTYESEKCTTTTLATQYKEEGQDFLHIDARLFHHPKHSEVSKAVLLLHELLYNLAREQGKTDSRSTREVVKLLITNNPNVALDKIVKTVFEFGFLGNRPKVTPEGLAIPSLDYTLQSGPMNALYSMAIGHLHHLGTIVSQFDEKKPEHLPSSESLLQRAQEIFLALGLKLEKRAFSSVIDLTKAQYILNTEWERIKNSQFNASAIQLKSDIDQYLKSRVMAMKEEMARVTPIFVDFYIRPLKYISDEDKEAILAVAQEVGQIYFDLGNSPFIPNGRSPARFDYPGVETNEKLFFSVEDLSHWMFPLLDWDLDRLPVMRRNLSWVTHQIYKKYHENGTLRYLDFKFPQI